MLSLLAAVLITSSGPSAAALAPRFVQVQASAPSQQPTQRYAGWTRIQLEEEWRRLDESRPIIAPQIAMMGVGAGVAVVDLVVWFFAALLSGISGRFDPGVERAIIIGAVVSGALLIAGGILLGVALSGRSQVDAEIVEIREALERLAPVPAPRPPPPSMQPPAQPLVPQQVSVPVFSIVLAKF